ncbi:FxsA family protein, partial [Vibrio campbellii]
HNPFERDQDQQGNTFEGEYENKDDDQNNNNRLN